ncbi:LolA family protein [Pseudoalteromonas ulvae]|uniref:Outer membrane lipoprotein carrier protein LolA n=1 Tax=Pseudoalteromonas ulvae TaxID=107327 RepID=A0A244CLJ5_PSEDV|nr:outer membrane lipoprotein carrier protein LolA [Pseudoalteromonas ulvae]OUL56472.1 hypothetical protein B1199_17575 [Pseudoalteromonas ulvae]
MNKWLILALLFVLPVAPLWADEALNQALARFVVNDTEQQTGDYQQEKYFKSLSQPMRSQGTFRVSRDEFVWQQLSPISNTLTLSQGTLINTDYRNKQQVIQGADAFLNLLSALLTVQSQQIAEFFTLSDVTEHCVKLTPHQGALSEVFALVTLCGQTQVEKLLLDEHNGNRTDIRLQFK